MKWINHALGGFLGLLLLGAPQAFAPGIWTSKAPMPIPRGGGVVSGVANGHLYVIGGFSTNQVPTNEVDVYNPRTDTWSTAAPIPTTTSDRPGLGENGKIYVVGGCTSNNDCRVSNSNILQVYDVLTNTWTLKTPMPTARHGVAAAFINGKFYVAGGQGADAGTATPIFSTLEVYDPFSDSWATKTPMPTPVSFPAAAVMDGKLYVAGGGNLSTGQYLPVGTLQIYDAMSDSWITGPSMPTARVGAGGGALNGVLYAVNGQTVSGATNIVEAYDPDTNAWSSAAPSPVARPEPAVASIHGVLYSLGEFGGTPSPSMDAFSKGRR